MKNVALLGLLIATTGCGGGYGSGGTIPPLNSSANGNWSGSIGFSNQAFPIGGTVMDMFIVQNDGILSSKDVEFNFDLASSCTGSSSMTGSIANNSVTMSMAGDLNVPSLSLTGTFYGDTISGMFTSTGGCDNGDKGNFSLSFIPSFASSTWAGSLTGGAAPLQFTANLIEDQAGNLTGTVLLAGTAPCNSPISVTGSQFGRQMSIGDSQGLFHASGAADSLDAKSISGSGSGSCVPSSDSTFNMTRP